ncbi:hypothetical protein JMJ35_008726 [Cladonia borealis]|uniref:Uncharacterized protein n=1 Tax=Cladonia borealis TaxID=184061 RepID=A0AA39QSQ4_9LECA|nr:hypothetical protein JMJ35_008726 [Cladonia borealis]
MPLDCSNVPSNMSYSCTNPWGQHCTDAEHFDFNSLWRYTLSIQEACANDDRLFNDRGASATPDNAALTQAACVAIAESQWSRYPAADIWTRLTTWKFPLLQLVASFPRPPLGLRVEFFVIVHVLGDPIDTIKCLLLKLSNCQGSADYWIDYHPKPRGTSTEDEDPEKLRDWKALVLLTDTYGEWGEENRAADALHDALSCFRDGSEEKKDLKDVIHRTADALAADRATAFLPIIVAQTFFVAAIVIAVGRTASAASITSDTVHINVEAHSIAYSALYFWIIPAVILSSVIGVSQTEASIPRILRHIQHEPPLSHPEKLAEVIACVNDDRRMAKKNLAELSNYLDDHKMREEKLSRTNGSLDNDRTKTMNELIERYKSLARRSKALEKVTELNESLDNQRRISHGGIYSWQPFRWQRETSDNAQTVTALHQGEQTQRSRDRTESPGLSLGGHIDGIPFASGDWKRHALPAYSIVILGTVTGMTISVLVPPDGPDCRHFGELSTCLVWLLSAWLDTRLNSRIP